MTTIPAHYLREIFADDPQSFAIMIEALKTGNGINEAFLSIMDQAKDLPDSSPQQIYKRVAIIEEKKAWHLRSITERMRICTQITTPEKISLYRGMLLTRATDNALKRLFLSGEITYHGKGVQGKGFRSLGQESIFAAPLKLKHGPSFIDNGVYTGDVAAPLIRDLGVFLAMSGSDVATAINAQAGKEGKPCDGRDLHLGDFSKGLITPAAPLAIATCTLLGLAWSFKQKNEARVALSFIGEGGSSLGEWHEAINCAAVLQLPMIFCIENNQTALSTPVAAQSRVRSFADKALGYGIHALSIDGSDVENIAAAFKFAADEARSGHGPIIIEITSMRMCGHAHHDDMLYVGKDPPLSFSIEPAASGGYVDQASFEAWRKKDPLLIYEQQLFEQNILRETLRKEWQEFAITQVEHAISEIKKRPWPRLKHNDNELVFRAPWIFLPRAQRVLPHHFSEDGETYISCIAEGLRTSFTHHRNSFLIGEDVAAPYGNAFMMFKPLLKDFSDRFINTPIAENAVIGACVGLALGGMRPIGEIQFNDFVACAMDQVVNNAAKHFFRTGLNLPMVVRLPYGGLRRAGPYHSQDTAGWFYQTPGLKIMAPSTPLDAMAMLIKAVDDPDPVLFFEHIALYRDPKIKQIIGKQSLDDIDGAALISEGRDITIISYGAYVHKASNVAKKLQEQYSRTADVIDLRYLMPLDFEAIRASVKKTSRVLLVGESNKTGSIMEMIAGKVAQELFFDLDAPVGVIGSRDIPVPYAPSLEDEYLMNEDIIVDEALRLLRV